MVNLLCLVFDLWWWTSPSCYSRWVSWAGVREKVAVPEALWGRQAVRLESEEQQRRSDTSGKKRPALTRIVSFGHWCSKPVSSWWRIALQAKGEGADGGAEEASCRGDWASQEGDWAPTEGDRTPPRQNQKAQTRWLKLLSPLSILSSWESFSRLFAKSMVIRYIDWFTAG